MWKGIWEWAVALFSMAREIKTHRERIAELEERVRDLEESIRLLAQEYRHSREMDASEREKLLLKLEASLSKSPTVRKKRK